MKLTLYTDYSLRVLLYLAPQKGGLASIGEIAQAYGISRNHLMKVVHNLGRANYVTSVRGRSGGIRLARSASEINVGAVVRTMEQDFGLVDCPNCRLMPTCGLRQVLGEAMAAFMKVLDNYSIQDLLSTHPGPLALFASEDPPTSAKCNGS